MKTSRSIALLAACLLAAAASAQTAAPTYPAAPNVVVTGTRGQSATIAWMAVTTLVDGTAVSGTVNYNVYESLGPVGAAFAHVDSTASLSLVRSSLAVSTPCWYITAVVGGTLTTGTPNTITGGIESAPSQMICAQVTLPAPNAPAAPTVTMH